MRNTGRRAGRDAGHRAEPIAQTRSDGGLIHRTIRALSLDSDLYREVSAPGASTLQAALVVMLAAVGVGLGESGRTLLFMLGAFRIESRTGLLWYTFVDETLPIAALNAVVHLATWPMWAAAVWIIGGRLVSAGGRPPRFGSVARGLAFAQAPGLFLILTPVLVRALVPIIGLATDSATDTARWGFVAFQLPPTLDFGFRTLISGWVLIGTYLAPARIAGLGQWPDAWRDCWPLVSPSPFSWASWRRLSRSPYLRRHGHSILPFQAIDSSESADLARWPISGLRMRCP